ncbi:MAG TPA: hypothetical protein VM284_01115 [Candidatus Limnocylindria bacterium]|nr:hypothetical protein [Candidatus Limnocylindria bacterium]
MNATIVDQTGLVLGCTHPDKPMGEWNSEQEFRIGNPGDDQTLLQIEWSGNPCDAAREYTLRESGSGYVLEGRSTYDREYCIMPLVAHVIQLQLARPIDVATVTFHWN